MVYVNLRKKAKEQGFTLVEVLIAGTLSLVTLTCIMQFFLSQLNQYRLISGNNALSESLRVFSKFFEKDVHNSLEFYVFGNVDKAFTFEYGTTEVSAETAGNCILFIQEKGMVEGGRGILYFVDTEITKNGIACYPLYRALVTFANTHKIAENYEGLQKLPMGYLKKTDQDLFAINSKTGIFATVDHRKFSEGGNYIPGCRHGAYLKAIFIQPGLRGASAESPFNFCFYSRNPRFVYKKS